MNVIPSSHDRGGFFRDRKALEQDWGESKEVQIEMEILEVGKLEKV